jgi:hypothetical protein
VEELFLAREDSPNTVYFGLCACSVHVAF